MVSCMQKTDNLLRNKPYATRLKDISYLFAHTCPTAIWGRLAFPILSFDTTGKE